MAPPIKLPFSGEKLRAARERRGLQQRDLVERTRQIGRLIEQGNLSRYETGKRFPSVAVFRTFVAALNCDPSELLDEPAAGAA
jgi:transcriptional regulator with XRE-family HTH domain